MLKVKCLIPVIISLAVIGCSNDSQPKQLTDEEYFSMMKTEFDGIEVSMEGLLNGLMPYAEDNSQYASMKEPAEKALAELTKKVEELKEIPPVPGWDERHQQLIDEMTYFRDLSREAVRTSKNGIKEDLGVMSETLMSHLKDTRRLEKFYRPDGSN